MEFGLGLFALDGLAQPLHALADAEALAGGAALDLPDSVLDGGQSQRVGQLRGAQTARQVLLVRVDEQRHVLELVVAEQLVQLDAGLLQPLLVARVHHVDLWANASRCFADLSLITANPAGLFGSMYPPKS